MHPFQPSSALHGVFNTGPCKRCGQRFGWHKKRESSELPMVKMPETIPGVERDAYGGGYRPKCECGFTSYWTASRDDARRIYLNHRYLDHSEAKA